MYHSTRVCVYGTVGLHGVYKFVTKFREIPRKKIQHKPQHN